MRENIQLKNLKESIYFSHFLLLIFFFEDNSFILNVWYSGAIYPLTLKL
jgi:hypothetical protein